MTKHFDARLPILVLSLIIGAAACQLPPHAARACTLGAEWRTGLLQCFLASCVGLMWAYGSTDTDSRYGGAEGPERNLYWRLALLRCAHYFLVIVSWLYAFLVRADAVTDTVYLVYVLGLQAHWLLFEGECALTLWEKRMLDPDYEAGSRPYEHVCFRLLFGAGVSGALQILSVLTALSCTLVLRRTFSAAPAFIVYALAAGLWGSTIYFNYRRPSAPPTPAPRVPRSRSP